MAFVESPKSCSTLPELDELERQALAGECKVTQEIAYLEQQESLQEGAKNDAKYKQAGAEQSAKLAEGSAEGRVATEMALPPAAGVVANLVEGVSEARLSNPSKGADVAQAKDKMGSAIVGDNAKSFEDDTRKMKHTPVAGGVKQALGIETAFGRSIFEKSGVLSASMKSLNNKDTKGIKQTDAGASTVQVSSLKQTLQNRYSHGIANEKVLEQIQAAKLKGAPAGPGGVGSNAPAANQPVYASNAPAMNHDKFGHFTPTKKFLTENDESGTVA